ncbi:MAG TPA: hypothetical protein VGB83_03795 [Actinomycetota bacterium]
MFARVSIFKGNPGEAKESTRIAREKVLPVAREMEGFAGFLILADDTTGKSMGITLWQTEGALRASEEKANAIRSGVADDAGDEIVGVERYEVTLDERA